MRLFDYRRLYEKAWDTDILNLVAKIHECKYRRGGKTLCSLYARKNCIGFMVILGKDERVKFDDIRGTLSDTVSKKYDEAQTYHDGKWIMFEPTDTAEFNDYMMLLAIKRKPNRK